MKQGLLGMLSVGATRCFAATSLGLLAFTLMAVSPWAAGSGAAAAGGSQTPASATSGTSLESARLSDAEIIDSLSAHIERLVEEDRFSGAVQVIRHGEVLLEGAYGWADRDSRIPNTLDTPFRGGSMNKMLTAVATMQLIQAGELALEDKLIDVASDSTFIDLSQFGPWAKDITVYHLLTHTSGLPHQQGEMLFEPGELWSYSNLFGLLSLFVESVTGQSYNDYVVEHIFRPAGMTDMEKMSGGLLLDQAANPYPRITPNAGPDSGALGVTGPGAAGTAAGGPGAAGSGPGEPGAGPDGQVRGMMGADGRPPVGTHWTIRDMQRFATALLSYELLDKEHLDMMMVGRYDVVGSASVAYANAKYGFGMVESTIHGVKTYGHSGSGFGVNAILDIYPHLGYVVSILSNYDNGMLLVNDWLRLTLAGAQMPEPVTLAEDALKELAGYYVPDAGRSLPADWELRQGDRTPQLLGDPPSFDITADAEGLWVDFGSAAIRRYLPLSEDKFFDRENPESTIHFDRDEMGQVTGLSSTGTRHFDGRGAGWAGDVVALRHAH